MITKDNPNSSIYINRRILLAISNQIETQIIKYKLEINPKRSLIRIKNYKKYTIKYFSDLLITLNLDLL